MAGELQRIAQSAESEIPAAGSPAELEERRIQFLGRERGALTLILRRLKDLPPKERAAVGAEANRLRARIAELIKRRRAELANTASESLLRGERLDVTRPGRRPERGHLHPLTRLIEEIETIFASMGFSVAEGPEVETEWYNFGALNIPEHHPARDMWDTLWIKHPKTAKTGAARAGHGLLLRTHTSPVQIRYMEAHNPPIRIIAPGRVYRHEATDATHEIQFHQLEGLMVDRDVSIAHFKFIIREFFSRLFRESLDVRLRPSYFPFTEPSFEVDIRSPHRKEWLEISGAGMVHPNVFKAVGYNPKNWQGFAFGMGIERLAMLKYRIPDIRLFHAGDLRFLRQF